ncbi:hypothetical protein H310_12824 [Aphanomyces invadans]|uniref:Acyltransferase 3 domain-containing protein n=1 Tax=Aphanomyces invadans TaxID=157072 RepID=A0A024TGP7_9STRA|nr:hypothetical protein H310_12824 [Aphanomyces invadans]ETV93228.1 hypothetical protein H310_12824 [Aphanomyces invadans]|eukprot:XP_008878251.1 hypothetical protein H310_12824 [Aphanomyces invadans]
MFPSGFIGVDIFFVISGYLISGILLKECKAGPFTYYAFYSRRLRRIFPILLLVMATTLWMGCLYLLATSLKALAATMLAGSLFCANLQVLSLEKGYFDDDIKSNPLLHLWSLGVEEQFYIFWPFLASVVARLPYRRALGLQGLVLAVSFVANIAFLGYRGSNKYAFYFPLCRFWQMSIGGVLAFLHFHDVSSASRPPSNAMSVAGLAMIIAGFSLIDETSVFPGFWAILPSCGAALLIGGGAAAAFNASVLSAGPVVYVGKISYALYLWHWPLLVFANVRFPNAAFRPFYMQPYMMVAVAVACSINFVMFENRVRRVKSKWIVPGLFLLTLSMSAVSLAVYSNPESFSLTELDLLRIEGPQDWSQGDVLATLAPALNVPANTKGVHALASAGVNLTLASARNSTTTSDVPVKAGATISTSAVMAAVAAKDLPNPSREKRVQNTTFLQAIQGGKDMNDVWKTNLTALNKTSPYGYHPHAQVLNPDKESNGLVIVLGDSHGDMTKPRFLKLYEAAVNANLPFPTMVFKTEFGRAPLSCEAATDVDFAMVKAMKPQVVFYNFHWLQYLRPEASTGTLPSANPRCCNSLYELCPYQTQADADELVRRWKEQVKQLVGLGIRVFVAQQYVENGRFYYAYWLEGNAVKAVPPPYVRSQFEAEHRHLLSVIANATQEANATLINFSDNLCWEDLCQVVNGHGEPVLADDNHIRAYTARNYLSVVDQVVEAALLHH